MEVCLLGTSGMIPLYNRFLASCYIEHNQKGILIDCGEGTQVSFSKTNYNLSNLNILLITHCHADHVLGIPGLLLTLGNCLKKTPLYIIGPEGTKSVVLSLMTICKYLPYNIEFIEIPKNKVETVCIDNANITAFPLFHPVTCIGYSCKFESDKFKLSYCTDTRPVETMKFIQNSDLFICEGMYGDDAQYENAVRKRHMLFSEAAYAAKHYNVNELWLTHFSPNIDNPDDYLYIAKEIFENTKTGKDFMKKVI